MAAILAAYTCEAVGEDAALQVGSEVLLHPEGDAIAHGAGISCLGEEPLKVVLDHGVERRGRGPAWPVDGPGRGPVGYLGRRLEVSVSWEPLGGGRHGGACTGSRCTAMAAPVPSKSLASPTVRRPVANGMASREWRSWFQSLGVVASLLCREWRTDEESGPVP